MLTMHDPLVLWMFIIQQQPIPHIMDRGVYLLVYSVSQEVAGVYVRCRRPGKIRAQFIVGFYMVIIYVELRICKLTPLCTNWN